MKKERLFSLCIGLLLVSLSWACQKTSPASLKGTVFPTTAAQIRKIPTEQSDTESTPFSETEEDGQFATYYHPSGVFQFQYPAAWQVETSEFGAVFISEPIGEGTISVTATYSGYALSGDGFVNYVYAREENFFTGFNDYRPGEAVFDDLDDQATVTKQLTYQDIPETVDSYYLRSDDTVFTIDVWMETSLENVYREMYQTTLDTFETDSSYAIDFPLYNFVTTFYAPLNLFSFEVPNSWQYYYFSSEGIIVDRFTSPDRQSSIEHVTIYDVKDIPSKEQEKRLAEVFNKIWDEPQTNLKVKNRDNFDDGSTYILWKSDKSDWQIETYYQVTDGKILALNGLIRKGYESFYQSTVDYAFDWYQVPAAED